jgi:beta-mannosidase
LRFLFFILILLVTSYSSKEVFYEEITLNTLDWTFRNVKEQNYYPAKILGTIHTDLFENKLIPDPFYGANEQALQWIENETWEYNATFSVTKNQLKQENIELQFDGLDTYAKVFLNDSLIVNANNMFISWNVYVKQLLNEGENALKIVFEPNAKKAKELSQSLPYTLPGEERVHIRKAQYHFGWDWGPRFVTCGIWKDVKLIAWSTNKIENVQIIQKELNEALAKIDVVVNTTTNKKVDAKISVFYEDELIQEKNFTIHSTKNSISFEIENPQLWWSNGLGKANTYEVKINLINEKNVVQTYQETIGLRTIELVQEQDGVGSSFYFKLNGVTVFAKGANMIPLDFFTPRVSINDYENLIENAVNANMNMLRVWGGGIYESNEFYKLCDKNAIMVWQDFMFACAMYPGDDAFLNSVTKEVNQQIIRLRNHPSIVLWCGNNENIEGWNNWGWQKQYSYSQQDSIAIKIHYDTLFHHIIPQAIETLDHSRAYHPSSPKNGWGRKESLSEADVHYWGVWWGKEPFDMYKKKVGRFVSEYGFQAIPSMKSLVNFIPENEREIGSASMKNHQKHPTGYETIDHYLNQYFIKPKSLDHYVYLSQLTQAIGMETAIEAHRKAMPYCMGSLYWQLNDCWPVTSWSTTDYYKQQKAAFYTVKNCFKPITIIADESESFINVYIVSDELKNRKSTLIIDHKKLNGESIFKEEKEVEVQANMSKTYYQIDKRKANPDGVFKLTLRDEENVMYEKFVYIKKPKELALKKPTLKIKINNDNTLIISCSEHLAKNNYLQHKGVIFDDNFFDLLPGETKTISFKSENKTKLSEKDIIILTLFDTQL